MIRDYKKFKRVMDYAKRSGIVKDIDLLTFNTKELESIVNGAKNFGFIFGAITGVLGYIAGKNISEKGFEGAKDEFIDDIANKVIEIKDKFKKKED